jgi:hypothetical protein
MVSLNPNCVHPGFAGSRGFAGSCGFSWVCPGFAGSHGFAWVCRLLWVHLSSLGFALGSRSRVFSGFAFGLLGFPIAITAWYPPFVRC